MELLGFFFVFISQSDVQSLQKYGRFLFYLHRISEPSKYWVSKLKNAEIFKIGNNISGQNILLFEKGKV